MSDVKVVRTMLATSPDVLAFVPSERVTPGVLPQGTAVPAIAVTHVSTVSLYGVFPEPGEMRLSRVQITCMARTYPEQKHVVSAVKTALPRFRGTVAGVHVDSILHALDGPDFSDDAGIYMQTLDYIVRHTD